MPLFAAHEGRDGELAVKMRRIAEIEAGGAQSSSPSGRLESRHSFILSRCRHFMACSHGPTDRHRSRCAGISNPACLLFAENTTYRRTEGFGYHAGKVGLLGTMPVMQSDDLRQRYRRRFDIEIIVPSDTEKQALDRVIFHELVRRELKDDSTREYLRIIAALRAEGAQGVILGCTEIFLLIGQSDLPNFPVFDTTELHVDALVAFAIPQSAV